MPQPPQTSGISTTFASAVGDWPENINPDDAKNALADHNPDAIPYMSMSPAEAWAKMKEWQGKEFAPELTRILSRDAPEQILAHIDMINTLPDAKKWMLYAARQDPEGALYYNYSDDPAAADVLTEAARRAPGAALVRVKELDDWQRQGYLPQDLERMGPWPYRNLLLKVAQQQNLVATAASDPLRMQYCAKYWKDRPDAAAIGAQAADPGNRMKATANPYVTTYLYYTFKDQPDAPRLLQTSLEKADEQGTTPDLYRSMIDAMNERHDELPPQADRFAVIDSEAFSTQRLFDMMITPNTEDHEEAFTTTYNKGLMDRLIGRLKTENLSLLDLAKDSSRAAMLPAFLETAGAYGRAGDILKEVPPDKRADLLVATLRDAESAGPQDIAKVADLVRSLKGSDVLKQDPSLLNNFETAMLDDYNHATTTGQGAQLGLLIASYAESYKDTAQHADLINAIAANPEYKLPDNKALAPDKLFDSAGRNIQVMTFNKHYEGKEEPEADASFNNMLAQYQKAPDRWKIEDHKTYIQISSRPDPKNPHGKTVEIFANRPDYDDPPPDKKGAVQSKKPNGVDDIFNTLYKMQPPVEFDKVPIIQRGHRYYIDQTVKRLDPDTPLVILGACGDETATQKVLDRAPHAQISSTRANGLRAVNDPMLFFINDTMLRQGAPLQWDKVQNFIDNLNIPGTEEYVLPPSNAALSFTQAYADLIKRLPPDEISDPSAAPSATPPPPVVPQRPAPQA